MTTCSFASVRARSSGFTFTTASARQHTPTWKARPSSCRAVQRVTCGGNQSERRGVVEEGPTRREALGLAAATAFLAALERPQNAAALGAPGLSPPVDGISVYTRPAQKSGNHGIGWGAIDPFSFSVPAGWDEVGGFAGEGYGGQEVDLRFESKSGGRLEVVIAPIRRFIDPVPDNCTIKDIGSPMKVIKAFGPEITGGQPVDEEDILDSSIVTGPKGRPYYSYDLKGRVLVSATVLGDRAYLITCKATAAQWRKAGVKEDLYKIRDSFNVLK
eukprot:CAMPEP_0118935140 /NCGR_PEP_ID=MMETSP1169-20130426/14969_1 /TAXON_ID=36882 /ORGANISM="Pyramimonas obovata, Strain CCMP722" /LENGTH=272 /DNA_ID=CAMNT_0006878127 /DNA_START=42 /DNA_END=860 /DNA_ORIENTATION=-